MDELLHQIAFAAENGIYFLSLAGALVIPDICGALEQPSGEATGNTYRAWFDQNVAPIHRGILDGDSCYRFRCSLLHQGTTQHPKSRYNRILFVEPGALTGVAHMNIFQMVPGENVLEIDVRVFCLEMVQAALAWRDGITGTEPYETNVSRFVTRYPGGLAPYVVGIPIIS